MEEIEKKVKGLISAATGTTIAMMAIGLVLICWPGLSIKIVQYIVGGVLIAGGIAMIAREFSRGAEFGLFSSSIFGVILTLIGLFIISYPQTVYLLTIIFGAYMIIASITKIGVTSRIRAVAPDAYAWSTFTNLVGLVCGIIMFFHPGIGTEAIVVFIGVMLLVYGISGLIDSIVLRARVDDLSSAMKHTTKKAKKTVKQLEEEARDGEVVDKKKKSKK